MGDGLVELRVHVVVGVEQVEGDATHVHSPHIGVHLIVHVGHVDHQWVAVFVVHTLDGERVELLCLVVGNLLSVDGQALGEIAKPVEKSHSAHVDIAVGCFFEVVAGKHSQTAGVDLEHLVQAVFHTEIGHRGASRIRLLSHVALEEFVDVLHVLHNLLVVHDLFFAAVVQALQQEHGVVVDFLVEGFVEAAPEFTGFVVPHPPKVVSQFVEALQLFG